MKWAGLGCGAGTWMSRWSPSHSGQLSEIIMVTERALESWLQRPCTPEDFLRLAACMSNRKLTEHWQLLETGRKRRNIDAQTDECPGLYCTQCAGNNMWHQSQQAQSVCLTANWPPLCWHSTSKHSLRETAQVRALARHTAVSSDIPQA